MLNSIGVWIGASVQRTGSVEELAKVMEIKYLTIPSKSETRWSLRVDQLQAFYQIYEVLVVFFEHICNKSCLGKKWCQIREVDAKTKATCLGFLSFLKNLGKVVLTFCVCDTLERVNVLSKAIQTKEKDFEVLFECFEGF